MLFCDPTQDLEMLMNCEKMQNSRLSYRKRNTRQSRTSQGIITRSMLRDGSELHRWSSTRHISGRPRTTKKSNDVFENVMMAPNVSDCDLCARETRLEATGRPFTNCVTDFGRQILEDITKQTRDEEKLGQNGTFVLLAKAFLPFGNCFIFRRTSIYERVHKNDCML